MAEDDREDISRIPRIATRTLTLPVTPAWPGMALSSEWREWLTRNVSHEIDQRRLFPWIAVCFGLGIVFFFQADGRPSLWAPMLGLALCSGGALALRHRLVQQALLIALAAIFAGFAAAAIRVRTMEAPSLHQVLITTVSGFVEAVDDRPKGKRILLRVAEMKDVPPAVRPRYVRVSLRKGRISPGQFIEGTARLLPPPQPAWPGGYDFARDAFFREIGAVGSMLGAVRYPAPPVNAPWRLRLSAYVDDARSTLTQRIASAIGGQAGAVGASLVTGKRGTINESTNEILRGAGIYHIVSISGLHMVLAAGTFFWLSRALLALNPAIALYWPVKKISASIAMVGAILYCVFSGSEVATERSLIMTLVMFGAVLVDRPALSARNLSIAALIILAREPEAVLGPSFQMSFGAVTALAASAPLLRLDAKDSPSALPFDRAFRWLLRSVFGLAGTTLVASLATAPFTAYHFQTLNPLGLIGNALALPLVSAVVMPLALLGVLAYPFGLDRQIWQIMGAAVAKVLDVSAWVSSLKGSSVAIPALGTEVVLLMGFALLVVTLLVSSLRWFALMPAGLGLALAMFPARFDVVVDREGAGAMIRGAGGRMILIGKPSRFIIEQWLQTDGDARDPGDPSLRQGSRCDESGCVVEARDRRHVAFTVDMAAFTEDCRRADVIVTSLTAPRNCGASVVLDGIGLQSRGATAVRFGARGIEMVSTRRDGEAFPWTGGERPRDTSRAPAQKQPSQPARSPPERDIPENDVSSDGPS